MTEAEFLRFLRHGGSRVAVIVEIEFARESGGSLATGTLYFADRPEAVSGSQSYADAIIRAPELERSIDLARLGGRGSRTVGSVTLNNTDKAFSYLLDAIIDGRDATVCIGGEGWARADYRTLCKGTVAAVRASGGEITIQLRDKNYLLDDTIIGDAIATGPNAGKPKPINLGSVFNFDATPYLLDASALTYYINNFALGGLSFDGAVVDVRDAGLSLSSGAIFTFSGATMTANTGTETLTYAGHGLSVNDVIFFRDTIGTGSFFAGLSGETQYWVIAAGLTADDFRVSLTKGGAAENITGAVMTGTWELYRRRWYVDLAAATIELSGSPSGRVTVDMQVQDAAGDLTTGTPHEVIQYVLDHYSKLSASDYDAAALAAEITLEAASILASVSILDRTNALDVLDAMSAATDAWYVWGSDGVLTVGRLDLANLDGETAIDTITETDILDDLSAENLPIPFGKLIVDHQPNAAVQTDGLASAVTAANKSLYAQKFQLRYTTTDPGTSGYLANRWDYHKSAIDSRPVELRAVTTQNRVDDTTELFQPWTRVHRCTVGIDKYALNPGDCVEVTFPDFGLDAGKNCRVISVRPRVSDRMVDLVLVRQASPDYTMAGH